MRPVHVDAHAAQRFRRVPVVHAFQREIGEAAGSAPFSDPPREIGIPLLQPYGFKARVARLVLAFLPQLHFAADALRAHDFADFQIFVLHTIFKG